MIINQNLYIEKMNLQPCIAFLQRRIKRILKRKKPAFKYLVFLIKLYFPRCDKNYLRLSNILTLKKYGGISRYFCELIARISKQ